MTGFYMKCNTWLKMVNVFRNTANIISESINIF